MKEKLVYVKENWKKERSLVPFIGTFLYTLGLAVSLIIDFTTNQSYTPEWAIGFYVAGLLPAYIGFKAADRWIFKIKWLPRHGELFVYLWVILSFVMYITERLTYGAFCTPQGVINITISVIGWYCFSRGTKHFHKKREHKSKEFGDYKFYYDDSEIYSGPSVLIIEENKGKRECI